MLILAVHTLAPLCHNSHLPVDINSHMRMLATHVSAGHFHPCWQPTGLRYSCWHRKCQCSLTAKTHPLNLPTRHISDPDRRIPISLCTGSLDAYAFKLFFFLYQSALTFEYNIYRQYSLMWHLSQAFSSLKLTFCHTCHCLVTLPSINIILPFMKLYVHYFIKKVLNKLNFNNTEQHSISLF